MAYSDACADTEWHVSVSELLRLIGMQIVLLLSK